MSLPAYDDPSTLLVTGEVGKQRLAADRSSRRSTGHRRHRAGLRNTARGGRRGGRGDGSSWGGRAGCGQSGARSSAADSGRGQQNPVQFEYRNSTAPLTAGFVAKKTAQDGFGDLDVPQLGIVGAIVNEDDSIDPAQ